MTSDIPIQIVTKQDIREAYLALVRTTAGAHGSALIIDAGANLRDLCEELLKERDKAFGLIRSQEAKILALLSTGG